MLQEELVAVASRAGITEPRGFRAVGIHCGIKKTRKDLALIVSDVPASAAAVFTLNKVMAAPVVLSKKHLGEGMSFRAIVVNSGNANACTGTRGYADALAMADETAAALGVKSSEVFVASTGVIGERLPVEKIRNGIRAASARLSECEHESAAEAILTTDTFKKVSSATFQIDGVTVGIGGIAKGSGMIHPNMATMLGFVTTDAAFEPAVFQNLLKEKCDLTFNRIVVDGDTSTNDMVVALANGECGLPPLQPHSLGYTIFAHQLEKVLKELALDIVRDGEGATKLVEVTVIGAATNDAATKAAKAIALSPLVKTAIHGEDANWGRIVAAVGYSGINFTPERIELAINSVPILKPEFTVMLSNQEANKTLKGKSINLVVNLNGGSGTSTCWTCDFSEEYVVINGSYRS